MNESLQTPASLRRALRVAAGEDRFGEQRGLGFSSIDFKVSTQESSGLFIRGVTKANAMPPQDPELWRAHGMELLGPPLSVE